jgi:hypothetical protein
MKMRATSKRQSHKAHLCLDESLPFNALAAKENELKQMSFVTLVIDVMNRFAK